MKHRFNYLLITALMLLAVAIPAAADTPPLTNSGATHSNSHVPLYKQTAATPLLANQQHRSASLKAEQQGVGIGAGSSDIALDAAHTRHNPHAKHSPMVLAKASSQTKHTGWNYPYQQMVKRNHIGRVNKVPVKRPAWLVLKKYQ